MRFPSSFTVILTLIRFAVASPLLALRASPASAADFAELQRAAKLSSAAYSGCLGSAFGVTITLQVNDATTDTQGFVGYDSTKKTIAVIMKGSTSAIDFANDANTIPVTPTLSGVTFPTGTQVMQGIYGPWSAVHSTIITEVRRLIGLYPSYTLESTGHSLGGSLTYLSYIALAQNFKDKAITSNAMAAFPIGNAIFAAFGTSQNGLLRRGNNINDGVPNMYTQFTHYGVEYYGSGTAATTVKCDGERDTACSAGNGQVGVTATHLQSFGIAEGGAGCA